MIKRRSITNLCWNRVGLFLAVLMLFLSVQKIHAASITVDSKCSLADAIAAANTDTAIGGCAAGNGADTIAIREYITLESPLPEITSSIKIEGNDYSISGDGKYPIFRVGAAGDLQIWYLTLTKGLAIHGGAVHLSGGRFAAMFSTIADNSAGTEVGHHGGAIYNEAGVVTIRFSNLNGNLANRGGAIFNRAGTLLLRNSTLDNNSAVDSSSALANIGGTVTITHVTMVDNVAEIGSSLADDGAERSLNLYNSLIADSSETGSCLAKLGGNSGNLIKDGTCDPALTGDPQLGNRSGTPAYYPLRANSPAIDAADPEYCLRPDQTQKGRPLPDGGECDIGAFEGVDDMATTEPLPPPDSCPLADQVRSANTDASVGGCPAGQGADTITLTGDILLREALPKITSEITIEGGGHSISGGERFRIFEVSVGGKLTINHLTLINGDRTIEGPGGGIRVRKGGELRVNSSFFKTNRAIDGGAIQNDGVVTISTSTFVENCCNWGGAISNHGVLTIDDSTFLRNRVGYWGAGIAHHAGNLVIRNSSFAYNEAWGNGGAIWIEGGESTITHVTMMYDKAVNGDGIFLNGGSLKLRNTVIFGAGAGDDCVASLDQNYGNWVGDGTCEPVASGIPLLNLVADSPPYYSPFNVSPLIDAAHGDYCLERDQAGQKRANTADDPCDIGAVEFQNSSE